MEHIAVGIADVRAAARRLEGIAHRTPVLTSASLDAIANNRVFLKCENLQRVGSFKFRGAYNALSMLSVDKRARGVVAFSSGNHAQGVALAAKLLGLSATIVMPKTASPVKLSATRGYGATVITYDPATEIREEIADRIRRTENRVLIPPFDHLDIIAGQGTAALELLEEIPDLDVLVTPAGGGGLLSGCAIAARAVAPGIEIVGAEPEAGNDWFLSWKRGEPVTIPEPQTIADGLRLTRPGDLTWPIVRATVNRFVTVPDAQTADAMRLVFERAKMVVEPAGAVSIAATLYGALGVRGKKIGVVISGGNVALDDFARIVAR